MLAILKLFVGRVAASIGGFSGWFWGKILLWGGQAFIDYLNDLSRRLKRKQNQDAKLEELEKVDANPKKNAEDVAKSYEDFINQRN